jgi:predicted aspartyl protease
MRFTFNPTGGLLIVSARIDGPSGHTYAQLALDTGATGTLIRTATLVSIGYDPAVVPDRVAVTTGSGVEYVPRLPVDRIEALGQSRTNFAVLAHTLPPSAMVDGLLGLDFLRGCQLTLDFRSGEIALA